MLPMSRGSELCSRPPLDVGQFSDQSINLSIKRVGIELARRLRVPEILTTFFPEILITSLPRNLAA